MRSDLRVAVLVASAVLGVSGVAVADRTITFDGMTPGSSYSSFQDGGYTLGTRFGGSIFVEGTQGGALPHAPVVFASGINVEFELSARMFDLKSLRLAPISSNVGARTVVFTGTTETGATVTHTAVSPATFTFSTVQFPASFTNLAHVRWSPNSTMLDDVVVHQGTTLLDFASLVPNSANASYEKEGYRFRADGGSLFVNGSLAGTYPTAPVVYSSNIGAPFVLDRTDSSLFDLFELELALINENTSARTVDVIGTKADGSRVTQTLSIPTGIALQAYGLDERFTGLRSVEFGPSSLVVDNLRLSITTPEPTTLTGLAGGMMFLRRSRRGR